MPLKWDKIRPAIQQAEREAAALAKKRAEILKNDMYSDEYKQQQLAAEIGSAKARVEDVFRQVLEDVADYNVLYAKQAWRKPPATDGERAAHFAERTYHVAMAGQLFAGLDNAGVAARLKAMTAEGRPAEFMREAIAIAESRIDRSSAAGLLQLRDMAAVKSATMSPEERQAAGVAAATGVLVEHLKTWQARAITNAQGAAAGNTSFMGIDGEFETVQAKAEQAARPYMGVSGTGA